MIALLQDHNFQLGFGIVTTIMTGVAGGTVHLTNMVPERAIPVIVAWASFFAFVNSAVLTTMNALH